LYQLEIGEAGESCALYIATRLGLPDKLIKRAKQAVSQSLNAPYHSILTEDTNGNEKIESVIANENKKEQDTQDKVEHVRQVKDEQATEERVSVVQEQSQRLSRIEKLKEIKVREVPTRAVRFEIGDSVMVYPQKKIGLVFEKTNLKGDIGVQIAGKKEYVNYKRLQLKAAAKDMYPDDYDFSIVFDTVANRKARHKMDKGHVGIQATVEAVKRAKN
jgi:dsDNA-specific endonuclease/ATPase MutS2